MMPTLKTPEPKISDFLENYSGKIKGDFTSAVERGKNKFIFDGPPGSGKSFLAEAFSKAIGGTLEVLNLYLLDNVEDLDQSSLFLKIISNAAQSKSLFDSGQKVIFIEDVEKLLSVNPKILKEISEIKGAIIIFESRSGEIFRAKNKSYLSGYELVRFYKLNEKTATTFARRVLSLNRATLSDEIIQNIVRNSRGNLTSIITDLNVAVAVGKDTYVPPRSAEDSVFEQLNSVFSGNVVNVNTHFYSDNEAKTFEIWLSDKAPQVFYGDRLTHVFEKISFSDILLRKIKKQNWGLLKYVQNLLFFGISAMSANKRATLTYFAPPWNIYYKHDE